MGILQREEDIEGATAYITPQAPTDTSAEIDEKSTLESVDRGSLRFVVEKNANTDHPQRNGSNKQNPAHKRLQQPLCTPRSAAQSAEAAVSAAADNKLIYVQLDSGREVEVRPIDVSRFRGRCRCMCPGGIQVGAGRFALPGSAIDYLPRYASDNCIVPGQVVVCTVPKSGTTWTLEMTWLLTHNCDFAGAKTWLDNNRTEDVGSTLYFSPSTEFFREYVPHLLTSPTSWYGLARMLRAYVKPWYRRETVVKTHMPLSMFRPDLLRTNKVIYVARNPKDALVSYYHHFSTCKAVKYEGTLDDLAMDYMAGILPGLPYFSHVLEAWNLRHHPNLLFLFYEEMKNDLAATLRKVAAFLGKSLTDDQVVKLCDHLSFDKMKSNRWANTLIYQDAGIMYMPSFIRQGKVGSWKQQISEPVSRQLDDWIRKSTEGTGLRFKGL